jgi:hypothetical protein
MRQEPGNLDARAFGMAAALVAAALSTICALGLAVAPRATTAVASALIHLDLSETSRSLTWGSYFGGLIGWGAVAGIIFWAAAACYNRIAGGRRAINSLASATAPR